MSAQEAPMLALTSIGEPPLKVNLYQVYKPTIDPPSVVFDQHEAEIEKLEAVGEIESNPLARPEFEDEPEAALAIERPRRKDPSDEKLIDLRPNGGDREDRLAQQSWRRRTWFGEIETDEDRIWLRDMEASVAIEVEMADMFEAQATKQHLGSMAARLVARFEVEEPESEGAAEPEAERVIFFDPLSIEDYRAFKNRGKAPIVDLSKAHPPLQAAIAA
jgi:hypothetical protein